MTTPRLITVPASGPETTLHENEHALARQIAGTAHAIVDQLRYWPARREFWIVEELCNGTAKPKPVIYERRSLVEGAWFELTGERISLVYEEEQP